MNGHVGARTGSPSFSTNKKKATACRLPALSFVQAHSISQYHPLPFIYTHSLSSHSIQQFRHLTEVPPPFTPRPRVTVSSSKKKRQKKGRASPSARPAPARLHSPRSRDHPRLSLIISAASAASVSPPPARFLRAASASGRRQATRVVAVEIGEEARASWCISSARHAARHSIAGARR